MSELRIKMSPTKVQGLINLAAPVDKKTLESFLGLANYFRDFIEGFSL